MIHIPSLPPGLFKHPKTGVYWVKRRVPADLVGTLGRKTVQESLGTKDRRLAETLFLERMGEIARGWSALAAGQVTLSRRTIAGLAGDFYRSVIAQHQDDPGEPGRWEGEIARLQALRRPLGKGRPNNPHGALQAEMHAFLLARGYDYGHGNARALVTAFAEARDMAYRQLAKMATGDFSPDPEANRFPALGSPAPSAAAARVGKRATLTVADHWADYVRDTGIALGTQKRFRPILVGLGRHLGTTNLADATRDSLERWTEGLASSGLAAKTVSEGYLAAARAFFAWGVSKRLIPGNPCVGITYKGPRTDKLKATRPKGLTDAEAALVLSETLRDPDPRCPVKFAAARRWIPWICAYTGARVNEITQLRKQDVTACRVNEETVWVLLITPEAGSVKDRKARDVPLHPHVVEQGFADFVRGQPPGPLFYNQARSRGGSEFNPPYQKVGEKLAAWVRDIGVTDEAVAPNHGWRHRFKTEARRVRMVPETRDTITGHAMRTEGEGYGDTDIEVMLKEILRLPRYHVEKPEGRRGPGEVARNRNLARRATAERARERTRGQAAETEDLATSGEGAAADCPTWKEAPTVAFGRPPTTKADTASDPT